MQVRARKKGEMLSAMDRLLEGGIDDIFAAMKLGLEEGGDVNERLPATSGGLSGRTLMHQIVELLCANSVFMETTNPKVYEILDWLLEHGADINAKEQAGYNALQVAIYQNKELHVIEYLLSKGADPNNRVDKGWISGVPETALRAAMVAGSMDYIRSLCKYGAKFRPEDIDLIISAGVFRTDVGPEKIKEFLIELMLSCPVSFLTLDIDSRAKLDEFFGKNIFLEVAYLIDARHLLFGAEDDLRLCMLFLLLGNSSSGDVVHRDTFKSLMRLEGGKDGFFSNDIAVRTTKNLMKFYQEITKEKFQCASAAFTGLHSRDK